MKKVTALAGALLLSSSLVAGCTQSAAPNRAGTNYDTNNTGRVQDIGNRVGVRNIGPDARNLTNNATNNLRVDSSLEARVETIPGIKDAKVLVSGNTAYVAINQGTNLQGKTGNISSYNGTRDRYVNNAVGGTYGTTYGTSGLTGTYGTTSGTTGGYSAPNGLYGNAGAGNMASYGANTYTGNTGSVHPGSYSIRNNGVYGTPNGIAGYGLGGAGIMSGSSAGGTYALDTNRQGYGNYYNAGTQTYGTSGTAGNTAAPYGTAGNMGTYGLNTTPGVTGRAGTMAGGTGTTYDTTGKGTTNGTTYGTTGKGTTFGTGAGMNGGMNRTYGHTGVGGVGTTGTTSTTVGHDNVSSDVKARVTAAIKQANPAIQNVYVTANPALTNRIGAFVRDVGTGHPLRGGNDLLDTLRRMFPATR